MLNYTYIYICIHLLTQDTGLLSMSVKVAVINAEFPVNLLSFVFVSEPALSGVMSVALHFLIDLRLHLKSAHLLFLFLYVKRVWPTVVLQRESQGVIVYLVIQQLS